MGTEICLPQRLFNWSRDGDRGFCSDSSGDIWRRDGDRQLFADPNGYLPGVVRRTVFWY